MNLFVNSSKCSLSIADSLTISAFVYSNVAVNDSNCYVFSLICSFSN
nr:MAG TPA: hypothetical protein [Caudoviricetes sp.]